MHLWKDNGRWLENGWKSRAEFQRSQIRRLFAVKIKRNSKKKKKFWLSLSIHSSQEGEGEEKEDIGAKRYQRFI